MANPRDVLRRPLRARRDLVAQGPAVDELRRDVQLAHPNQVRVLDRASSFSLYDTSIAGFAMKSDYDQKDAEGFINILGLPIKLAAIRKRLGARGQSVSESVRQ